MIIDAPKALLLRAIAALEYEAHHLAGMSQEPCLFTAEETKQWADAEQLRQIVKNYTRVRRYDDPKPRELED